jgi:hypothetical protein
MEPRSWLGNEKYSHYVLIPAITRVFILTDSPQQCRPQLLLKLFQATNGNRTSY